MQPNSRPISSSQIFYVLLLFTGVQTVLSQDGSCPKISGLRSESDVSTKIDSVVSLYSDEEITLRFFGTDITADTLVSFAGAGPSGSDEDDRYCGDSRQTDVVSVSVGGEFTSDNSTGTITYMFSQDPDTPWYLCVKSNATDTQSQCGQWVYQSDDSKPWLLITATPRPPENESLLPIWLQCFVIGALLTLSGLFSGLNLGLMALDLTELLIIQKCGTVAEKRHAKKIRPVRAQGNYLLCSLLLGNVLVNNTLAILLDDLTSGLWAIIGATAGIVIFGEIVPQSICSRHGLSVGSNTVWLTRFFMVVTFPVSWPISKLLDLILGEEIGNVYNRERLLELVKISGKNSDLDKGDIDIISGALEMKNKMVSDIMTRLDDCFMLEYNSNLDFNTMTQIMQSGFTRIPIYEGGSNNITGLLIVKDLAFVDPDDCIPLKTLCKFYNHPVITVFSDTKLDVMLDVFKKGQSHMAFVQEVNDGGEHSDPFYQILGIVTLEDVIEEIIQSEIVDETDVLTDNRSKKRIPERKVPQDFTLFQSQDEQPKISSQLKLALYQFLSTAIDPFGADYISETILRKLLNQNIGVELTYNKNQPDKMILYSRHKSADYFIIILEGRVQVIVSREELKFEQGPFSYFGLGMMMQGYSSSVSTSSVHKKPEAIALQHLHPSYPDYDVAAITNLLFVKIHRRQYLAAKRATQMERSSDGSDVSAADQMFRLEWDRADKSGSVCSDGTPTTEDAKIQPADLANNNDQSEDIKKTPHDDNRTSNASQSSLDVNDVNMNVDESLC